MNMKSSTAGFAKPFENSGTNQLLKRKISFKPGKLDKFILAQVAWCTIPALVLVRMGSLKAGSIWCFAFLLVFLSMYALKRNIPAFVAISVAALPALSYTREFFFYNSVLALLGLGLGLWFVRSPRECSKLWDNQLLRWFFITGTVYWLVSVLLTRQYHSNLRVMEMLCSAGSIYLLAKHPKYLASALAGLGISIFSVAIGMLGQGDRMGMAEIDGEHVGNPISFGLPVALFLVLAIADNAKWLFLQHSKIIRNVLVAMCGVFLLLSTSRGSLLVAFVGIAVAVFYQSQQRRKIFVAFILMGCVLLGVLQTKSGEKAFVWFEKLTESDRSLTSKTSGRYEMWLLFPRVLEDSPIWGVGPGLGKEAYAYYSLINKDVAFKKGEEMVWHSLYMNVGVETGIIGLAILAVFLWKLVFRGVRYRQVTGNVVPLIGILCFMTIGISVPALDGISGLFLGLAFLGTMPLQRQMAKKIPQQNQGRN